MKKILLYFLAITFSSCAAQNSEEYNSHKTTYLDETGKEISQQESWNRRTSSQITLWHYIAPDTGKVSKLVTPVYSPILVNYPAFKDKLEEITGRKYDDKIFLLEYRFFNDLCTEVGNRYNKSTIKKRKRFTSPNKKEIEKRNRDVVILNFFEEGISLANSPESAEEYFFQDKGNFLRNILFNTPALCGSFALVKPNGQTLVINGESYASYIEEHLIPANWSLFFD